VLLLIYPLKQTLHCFYQFLKASFQIGIQDILRQLGQLFDDLVTSLDGLTTSYLPFDLSVAYNLGKFCQTDLLIWRRKHSESLLFFTILQDFYSRDGFPSRAK